METGNVFEKMGAYDFFARLISGSITILFLDLLGLLSWYSYDKDDFSILALVVAAYFVGVVLEELLWICSTAFHWLSRVLCNEKNNKKEIPST